MVSLKCNGGSCKGTLKLVYETKAKNGKGQTVVTKVTVGSASFSLAAGADKTVAVKLNQQGRHLRQGSRQERPQGEADRQRRQGTSVRVTLGELGDLSQDGGRQPRSSVVWPTSMM